MLAVAETAKSQLTAREVGLENDLLVRLHHDPQNTGGSKSFADANGPPAISNDFREPDENMASLWCEIRKEMVESAVDRVSFVPHHRLEKLITDEIVTRTLTSKLGGSVSSLSAFVCDGAKSVFATLAWGGSEALIVQFSQHGFTDEMLPIHLEHNADGRTWTVRSLTDGCGISDEAIKSAFCPRPWTHPDINHFYDYQWLFLAPLFSNRTWDCEFHPKRPLPFLHGGNVKESYFSWITEYRIHRDHLLTDTIPKSDEDPRIAIKELKRLSTDAQFEHDVQAEADALQMIRELDHPHLIKAIAYYRRAARHYFMFPWAGEGNLRDFWEKTTPPQEPDPGWFRWVFGQLQGLADAIKTLHHSSNGQSCRHGDLKPENILCFDDTREQSGVVFVIADVGLARVHQLPTPRRVDGTRTMTGTWMYGPPEAETQRGQPRSRRYDIWSMGCIYLEFVIWLLYGTAELKRFRGNIEKFYSIEQRDGRQTARIHDEVQVWIDCVRQDSRCHGDTALRHLLELVVTRLLVVKIDPTGDSPHTTSSPILHPPDLVVVSGSGLPTIVTTPNEVELEPLSDETAQPRATANEMYDEIKRICGAVVGEPPTMSPMDWTEPSCVTPQRYRGYLQLPSADSQGPGKGIFAGSKNAGHGLDDIWEHTPDNELARDMLAGIDLKSILPAVVEPPDFCNRCRSLQLWSAGFSFSDTPAGLVEGSTRCSLCRLLSRCLRGREIGEHENVRFFRVGSYLTIQDTRRQPIVSIYTMPGSGTPSPYIQIGFPKLPAASSPIHMRVLAEWIRGCDRAHQCYPRQLSILPTRVLDVGDSSSRTLRLACRPRGEPMSGRYLALSHRWGSPQQHKKFCTYATNIGRLTRSIDMDELPRTFRDAVTITRGLGIQYLWIDSLCIIQDDPEDWDMESKLMEEVFSSAYCTIAASCASGTDDGFLKPRPERRCVAMRRGSGAPYYLCDAIDDFPLHVDQGELNKRGWVLQERALSRRTIYFTEKQSYWECGVGVRCETLTTMRNLKASFLGDSNFPHSAEAYVKGTKIQLYQSLYERYSNLALSVIADRPTAIRGLEKRLVRTFNTLGGYGIFDCYLHRGLLWQRAGDSVRPIVSLRGERVPSWSWMAYEGGITYVDVPFGEAAWNNDVTSPFRGTGRKTHSGDSQLHGGEAVMLEMEALAYELVWPDNPLLILDEPDRTSSGLPKCVIIGIGKSEKKMDKHQAHYVLVVSVLGRDRDVEICERIGVGCLEGDQIAFDRPATEVRIW